MTFLSHDSVTARNNLRAMKEGDYAFFYHSSCKVPGIVGLMEIVREHSVDGEHKPKDEKPSHGRQA
jgi:predicted RNA-binding protein with PUA-like domain